MSAEALASGRKYYDAGSHHGRWKGNETGSTYKGRDSEADGPGSRKAAAFMAGGAAEGERNYRYYHGNRTSWR